MKNFRNYFETSKMRGEEVLRALKSYILTVYVSRDLDV